MAKRKGRRRMGRYIRGLVNETLALGTLASETLVSVIFDDTISERALLSSIVATYTQKALTPAAGVGPIMVGIAHSDYSDAEIENFVENTGTWKEADLVAQEVGNRKVRIVGVFGDGGSASATDSFSLNDGKPIKTKLNWILTQGQSLRLWSYNLGSAAVATTDPQITAVGHVNIFPK